MMVTFPRCLWETKKAAEGRPGITENKGAFEIGSPPRRPVSTDAEAIPPTLSLTPKRSPAPERSAASPTPQHSPMPKRSAPSPTPSTPTEKRLKQAPAWGGEEDDEDDWSDIIDRPFALGSAASSWGTPPPQAMKVSQPAASQSSKDLSGLHRRFLQDGSSSHTFSCKEVRAPTQKERKA